VTKPQLEVADIFRKHGKAYRQKNPLPLPKLRAMRAIEICRTAELGGHMLKCEACDVERPEYNSCRNRHCPKCQFSRTQKWIEARRKEVLPIHYFHVVFTIPAKLNAIVMMNQRDMYTLFFKSVSETLIELGKDPRHLGAQLGVICVLHTWGQTLTFHPHIHCIVTGGGLSDDSKQWISSRKDFFMSVHVLGKLFRGKFLSHLKAYHKKKGLSLNKETESLSDTSEFSKYLTLLYNQNWIVYAKPPFNGAKSVIDYLARYTHKVAISNHRIMDLEKERVTFDYRDYADGNTTKQMTLKASEFIRRFLMHVLPNRFIKIRYYGFLCSRKKKENLKIARDLLKHVVKTDTKEKNSLSVEDHYRCPTCKKGQLIKIYMMKARWRGS
jgi:hypothetical protein